MTRTTKRASERRGAEEAMVRTAVHGRGTRQCLEKARAANIAASDSYQRRATRRERRVGRVSSHGDARRMGALGLAASPAHVALPVLAGRVVEWEHCSEAIARHPPNPIARSQTLNYMSARQSEQGTRALRTVSWSR